MANQASFEELESKIAEVLNADSADFIELATLLDLDPITGFTGADLSRTDLRQGSFAQANFAKTNLHEANLSNADLSNANLNEANLSNADLSGADLSNADLSGADLSDVDLSGANLSNADLSRAVLSRGSFTQANFAKTNLHEVSLNNADLSNANLNEANLSNADLSGANLSNADLSRTQVLDAKFEQAILTGACLEDWNVNRSTTFGGTTCDYVYLKAGQRERRPSQGTFEPGELALLLLKAAETVDLIFTDGIDWQALFQSLQDLRNQYADQDLSIQAIEKKRGGAFIVRVEVADGADKKTIESSAKELYETKLLLMEQRYRAELKAKDGEIVAYREQNSKLMKIIELMANKPINVATDTAIDFKNASDIDENLSSYIIKKNEEDIYRLINSLRETVNSFPAKQREDTQMRLNILEEDVKSPEKYSLSYFEGQTDAFLGVWEGLTEIASSLENSLETFKALNQFIKNVLELTEKLGVSAKQISGRTNPPQLSSGNPRYDLSGAQFAGGFAESVQGVQVDDSISTQSGEAPSLAEAATDIQNLLKQLASSNPSATEAEQVAYLNAMISPTRRKRFIGTLRAGGAAIDEIPNGSILKALVEGWQKTDA